jgi:hypothetical protein
MTKPDDSFDALLPPAGARPGRRSFLLGIGAAAAGASALDGQQPSGRAAAPAPSLPDPLRSPDLVMAFFVAAPETPF